MMRKRIIYYSTLPVILTILMSMLTGCSSTGEIPIPDVEEDIYIYDEDDIIDDSIEKNLNKMLVELEEKTEVEFAIITVESLLNNTIEEYSNNLFNTLGIGKKDKDNGLLLLISRSDERVRLEIGRGLEGFLNDAKCGRILDDYFVPYRESDEYTKATELTVQAVLNVIAEKYEIDIQGLEKDLLTTDADDEIPLWVWIIIIIVIVVILIKYDGGNSSSSGYYGGYSSSSSGGGFGGGFSGGGGASR